MASQTERKYTESIPPPADFCQTAGKYFAWLKQENIETHGHDAIEKAFIQTKMQQLLDTTATLLLTYEQYDIGERISSPEKSIKKNGIVLGVWRGPTDVWSIRMRFTDHAEDYVRINAILAPPGTDMTNFIFPPSALANETYGFCRTIHNGIAIEHIHENGSTETDKLTIQQHLFQPNNKQDFVVWLSVDHGAHHEAIKYPHHPAQSNP
jgi:hypothetical protein